MCRVNVPRDLDCVRTFSFNWLDVKALSFGRNNGDLDEEDKERGLIDVKIFFPLDNSSCNLIMDPQKN